MGRRFVAFETQTQSHCVRNTNTITLCSQTITLYSKHKHNHIVFKTQTQSRCVRKLSCCVRNTITLCSKHKHNHIVFETQTQSHCVRKLSRCVRNTNTIILCSKHKHNHISKDTCSNTCWHFVLQTLQMLPTRWHAKINGPISWLWIRHHTNYTQSR